MKNISYFLNIKFEESMMFPHLTSKKVDNSFILKNKKINDDPNEIFSEI